MHAHVISARAFRYLPASVLLCLFCVAPVGGAAAGTAYWFPYVTDLSTTSATINWLGDASATGTVDYATSDWYNAHGTFQNTVTSPTTGAYQHVPLTGLAPDTSYVYLAHPSDNVNAFGNRTFKTMPVSGPFTFIALSDAHAQDKRFKYVADAIAANETDVLFILDGGDYANYDDQALWTPFFQYGDKTFAKFPLFTTIGNHEYHNPDPDGGTGATAAVQYHSSYDIAEGGDLYYYFDCSGVRFIILDSPDPANANDMNPTKAHSESQAPWLEGKLQDAVSGVFTIHHHPVWQYGKAASDSALESWEALYLKYNISANFSGHVHNYERHSVQGVPHFVIGNAGGKFEDMNQGEPVPPYYQVGDTKKLGYLKVTVDPANNTATAQEIFVAWVATDTSETATVYNPPVIFDTITFPLKADGGGDAGMDAGIDSGVVYPDSGQDAGPDAGAPDAGVGDTGSADASVGDAGIGDAGGKDAGSADAGGGGGGSGCSCSTLGL